MMSRVTAVFDSQAQAEQAVSALRQMGISDANLSFLARHGENAAMTGTGSAAGSGAAEDAAADAAGNTGKGLLAGAGIGSLFGLAAALIPGAGPFIAAGTLATMFGSAAVGGAVAGAVVGGTSGAIAGALAKAGYNESDAHYYGSAVESGGAFVAVDTDGSTVSAQQIQAVLAQHGGRSAANAAA